MLNDAPDVVSSFICSIRLRHICTALGCIQTGLEGSYSLFAGGARSGSFCVSDELGMQSIVWGDAGLVAMVYVGEDDVTGEMSKPPQKRRPQRHFESAPSSVRKLVDDVIAHPQIEGMGTGGFWLTREHPSVERLHEKGLESLRGYLQPPDVAIFGEEPNWIGWMVRIHKAVAPLAVHFEAASRERSYSITPDEGEALLPVAWFRKPGDARKPPTSVRPIGDSITLEKVSLAVERLADVGIAWESGVEIAVSRGVESDGGDEG